MTLHHRPGEVQSSLEGLRVQKNQKESREGVRVRDDIKGQQFLMMYTQRIYIQQRLRNMTSEYMHIAWQLLQYESVDRLWTRVRIRTLDNYQSTTDIGLGRHVTWKSCDRVQSGLEGLRVQKDREESRRGQGQEMMSRDMGFSWCTHGVHMYSGD